MCSPTAVDAMRRVVAWLLGIAVSAATIGSPFATLRGQDVRKWSNGTIGDIQFEPYVPPMLRSDALTTGPMVSNNPINLPSRRREQAASNFPPIADPQSPRSRPLEKGGRLSESLRDPFYVNSVGGVAFDRVAEPVAAWKNSRIRADYDDALPDGMRLVVFVDDVPYMTANLPDWQLLPIARYADSQHTAVVTLFGQLLNGDRADKIGAAYVAAFHPSLEGTLLGLRLFQTDYMLLDNSLTGELPKFGGAYLIGPDEKLPDRNTWRPAAYELAKAVSAEPFQSYVICDQGEPVTFRAGAGPGPRTLELTGGLMFYFWKMEARRPDVLPIPRLTELIYGKQAVMRTANPQVYSASVNTLRYAALFRRLKQSNPESWKTLLATLNAGISESRIAAPTPVIVHKRDVRRN